MQNKDDWYYIKRVLEGDPDAYAPLVERYKVMVYNISLKVVKRPEDAEEIAQDAFIKAYRSLKSFKGDAKFSTWLYRIVWNSSVSYLRSKKRREIEANAGLDKIGVHDHADDKEMDDEEQRIVILKKATDSLPADEQMIITLYYYRETGIDEIARIMNLSVSNVKVKLFRTRKKLRDLVEKTGRNVTQAG